MKIGEQGVLWLELFDLDRLRLFHLYDQISKLENVVGGRSDRRACCDVSFITETDGITCHSLDDDVVAIINQFLHACRCKAYAIFLIFDFLWRTNLHVCTPC